MLYELTHANVRYDKVSWFIKSWCECRGTNSSQRFQSCEKSSMPPKNLSNSWKVRCDIHIYILQRLLEVKGRFMSSPRYINGTWIYRFTDLQIYRFIEISFLCLFTWIVVCPRLILISFYHVFVFLISNSILQYKEKLQWDSKAPKRKNSVLGTSSVNCDL